MTQGLRLVNESAKIHTAQRGVIAVDIELINRDDGLVVSADGQIGQVVRWTDSNGCECSPEVADGALAVIGCQYVNIRLYSFVEVRVH